MIYIPLLFRLTFAGLLLVLKSTAKPIYWPHNNAVVRLFLLSDSLDKLLCVMLSTGRIE